MNKVSKKIILFFVTLIMLLGIFVIPVQAVETINSGFKVNSVNYNVELKKMEMLQL